MMTKDHDAIAAERDSLKRKLVAARNSTALPLVSQKQGDEEKRK